MSEIPLQDDRSDFAIVAFLRMRYFSFHTYTGTSLIRKSPPPLGPPYDPRYSPAVGS